MGRQKRSKGGVHAFSAVCMSLFDALGFNVGSFFAYVGRLLSSDNVGKYCSPEEHFFGFRISIAVFLTQPSRKYTSHS